MSRNFSAAAVGTCAGLAVGVSAMLLMACTTVPSPTPTPSASVIQEDSPEWDCRTMGNQVCGVQIEGDWYLVQFHDGQPVGVTVR